MSQEYHQVTPDDVNVELQQVLQERLLALLQARQPGHCMRVGDLDTAVMLAVARKLREQVGSSAQVHVLAREVPNGDPLPITSSKLVELRNPLADGQLRPRLLVFVPNDLRTAAEDSFAEATFEQVSVADAFSLLRSRLTESLPEALRATIPEIISQVESRPWRWADSLAVVRFLLSIRLNGYEPDVVGAALSELGLVPDFHLLDDSTTVPNRLAKNLECLYKLTFSTKSDRGRVLDLKLSDHGFRFKLSDFLAETGLEDPPFWTRRIVAEKQFWPLSFDKWQFEAGAGITQQLRVEVTDVILPVVPESEADPRLQQLIGQKVLLVGKGGLKSFKVKFHCDPAPENVPAVHHFRLQVISRESGPTAFTKKKSTWSGTRRDGSVSFSGVAKVEWEDGWHFVRVLPCTEDGDPIPIVDTEGNHIPLVGGPEDGQLLNESDLFYVVKADDVEVEVPQRAVAKFPSLSHAQIHFWFKALADGHEPKEVSHSAPAWLDAEDRKGKTEVLEFKFAGEGLIHVPISRVLKVLEQRILAAPDDTLSWRMTVSSVQNVEVSNDTAVWPAIVDLEDFRARRREMFGAIRGPDTHQIIQSTDLFPLRDAIANYAQAYLSVLSQALRIAESAPPDDQPRALAGLQTLLSLDTARVDLADHRGSHRFAFLVSPTHPLRLLWLATWLTLADHWLQRSAQAPKDFLTATRDSLLDRLNLANFPAVFPAGSGRLLTAIDNLHPLWTLYGSVSETDPRGLLAELCTALGLPEPNIGSFSLNGEFLAERTLQHHFDPEHAGAVDRPDRIIKTQELINLLEFYLDRAHRLHLLSPEAYEEAKCFLRIMERGYRLRFTRSAIVFDFDKDGTEEFVDENGIEFHRIGVNLIRTLLEALPAVAPDQETRPLPPLEPSGAPALPETSTMQLLAREMPKLPRAAFIREKRAHTAAWDKLSSSSSDDFSTDTTPPDRTPVFPLHPRMQPTPPAPVAPPAPAEPLAHAPAPVAAPLTPAPQAATPAATTPPAPTTPAPVAPTVTPPAVPSHDVLLGVTGGSPQFGLLGKVMGRTVALDLNQTHTISLFGVQGGGKSYTLGSVIEMASLPLPGINLLPQPLATVVFHYSQTQDYKPEFTSMIRPNDDTNAVAALAADYQAKPAALKDIVLLAPSAKLEARRAEYPGIEVLPLKFASAELQASHWRFLMGAVGNQATYIRRLNQVMRSLRDNLTLAGLRDAVAHAGLPDNLTELANLRLDLAAEYIDDSTRLSSLIRPGRLLIVDLRDEFLEKDEALGLFVVLLQLFGDATFDGKFFNKLVVFDEAHKYISNPDLVEGLVSVVREMRHKGTSILVASQDPPSVPVALIELSSQIILHRFNSPAWLKHIQKANAALLNLTPEQLARLQPGEAFVWSSKATDALFFCEAVKLKLRPRATLHGGATKTAVSPDQT